MVSHADLHHAHACLNALDFLVVQDIFLTETAQLADVVFPSACFAEKEGTFTNTERRVQRVRKAVNAPGTARADWEILCDVSSSLGYPMSYPSPREIMQEIAMVTPSYGGITYDRLKNDGIQWPCPEETHSGTPILHKNGFMRGKGKFHAVEFIPPAELPDAEYPFILTTGRVLYHYHTGTMTRQSEELSAQEPRCFVEISREDADRTGLKDGGFVTVSSRRGNIVATVRISGKALEGTVFLPFHFAEAAANTLTNSAVDPIAGIPELKVCAVKLAPAEALG